MPEETYAALTQAARQARETAVVADPARASGAALLARDGSIFTGARVETAAGEGLCAAQIALANALLAGKRRFTALALCADTPDEPCETCCRMLRAFGDMWVVRGNSAGQTASTTLSRLAGGRTGGRQP